jgi:hypothetical protein
MKLLKLGTVALDATKTHANAARHSALSYGHAGSRVAGRAEVTDAEPLPKGLNLPTSWRGVTGACKPSARRRLTPLTPGPRAQDQINLTDPDSRILPTAGASSKATKRRWIPTRCWWSPRGSAKRPTTSSRSRPMVERCLARGTGRGKRDSWPTPATSVRPTWSPVSRRISTP